MIFAVPAGRRPERADRFVTDRSGLSRSHVQRLISEGRLTADGRAVRASSLVTSGMDLVFEVPEPRPSGVEGEAIPLSVVYEDRDLLVIDKPAGMVVHPAPGHQAGTLVNALLGRGPASDLGTVAGISRPGIVHRLDKDTSGLLVVAKNDAAQVGLMAQLKERRMKKRYLALVGGSVAATVGRIEAPIGRDPHRRTRMAVVPDGRPAVTGYRVRERFPVWTFLELDLVTGRTHQLRVHLASIGHPIAGDRLYASGAARTGPDGLGRLFLHAWRIEFASPTDAHLIRAEAPLPPELSSVLEGLRRVPLA
jgi:23S rRNA pseudouridine1911/1915/1917 synthase